MDSLDTDHYATLGLDRRCTTAQIRSAYRLLAKRHHPDVNGGSDEAQERTRALNAAHETLVDPARRRAYDRELEERDGAPAAKPARTARVEKNIAQDVLLRIGDFLRGTTLDVRVNDPGNPRGVENYTLVVPAETAPGERFRLAREEPFAGGYVNVRVKLRPDARFKARGSDLRCDLRISAQRAANGGMEMLQGAGGSQVRVTIPPGIARGETVRIPREGLPKPRGGRGDLLVRVMYRPEVRVTKASGW